MTVASAIERDDYVGNGAVSSYSYTFKILSSADLAVFTCDTSGVETALALTTDFTVSGVGVASGGSVSLVNGPLASSYTLTIKRDLSIIQSAALAGQRQFFGSSVEAGIDRLAMISQMLSDGVSRSLRIPDSEDGSNFTLTLPTAANRANLALGFDASGDITVITGGVTGGFTAGNVLHAGATGLPTGTSNLYWNTTSSYLQLGGSALGTLRLKNDSGLDTPFSVFVGKATFNGTRDDILFVGYNLSGDTGDTRINTSEPAFKLGIEANYNTGAQHFLEYNWDYMNAAGVGKQRPFAFGVDRATDLYTFVFAATQYYLKDNSGNNHFQFATPIGAAPVFTVSYTDTLLYATLSVDSSGFLRMTQNANDVLVLGQSGWFKRGDSGNSNSDTGKSTQIGYDNSLNIGFIQCADWLTAFKPMKMNALEWRFYCNNTRLVNFFSGGDVGINQSTDRSIRLDVLDATNPQLRLTYTDNSVYTNFLTDSSGNLTITPSGGHVLGPAGTATNPGYSFSGDPDTGMFSWAANLIGWSAGGTTVLAVDASGLYPPSAITFQIGAGSTLSCTSDILTIARGGTPQAFRVMGTTTGSKYTSLSHDGVNGFLIPSAGQMAHAAGALATNATIGYFTIPSCAGAPTGVPANIPTGQIPMIYDSTNNFLYVYNGGWKKSTVYA